VTWRRRVAALSPIGVSPETLTLSVALAVLLGVFPVYGCPTLLCAAAAVALRLNLPAMQLVNLLTSPLQLALLVPFGRLGARLVHVHGAPTVHANVWQLAQRLGTAALHAVAGWCCVAAPLGILLYLVLRAVARGHAQRALPGFDGAVERHA
jgi:uncharacterized protein (DUF2062 family)